MTDPVSEATPLDEAIESEERRRVRAALNTLTPEFREVVVLSYFEGLSQSEIAERLEAPLGTVKTRVRRALLQLRRNLQVTGVA